MARKGLATPAYTRREYIKGPPRPAVVKYVLGNTRKSFTHRLELVSATDALVRDNALEAARVATNKLLERRLGIENYRFTIAVHPHHVIRENKMLGFAGADRIQKGMRLSFGKSTGLAARVKRGKAVLVVEVDEGGVDVAKEALARGASKLPIPYRVIVRSLS